jgi:hypothetical protein
MQKKEEIKDEGGKSNGPLTWNFCQFNDGLANPRGGRFFGKNTIIIKHISNCEGALFNAAFRSD